MILRPSQQEAVDFALTNLDKPVALALPTAFGKTHTAKAIADRLEGRTAIVTLSNILVKQFFNTFPIPLLVGKRHYRTKEHYDMAVIRASTGKTVIFNPASYFRYLKNPDMTPFDNIILDEADACLQMFRSSDPLTIPWDKELLPSNENIYAALMENSKEAQASSFANFSSRKWWTIESFYSKKTKKEELSLNIHDVILGKNFIHKFLPKKVVAMSGTLFSSYCRELFGTSDYAYYEGESPIPVERRYIEALTEDEGFTYPTDYDGLHGLLMSVLDRYTERPAIVHVTYEDVAALKMKDSYLRGYLDKAEKQGNLKLIYDTDHTLLAPGATTGLDLKGQACRLNVILRGQFANKGSDYVMRRIALPDGPKWALEHVLREVVQACGRAVRSPDDWAKTVIADCRLTKVIKDNQGLLPKYFLEALKF